MKAVFVLAVLLLAGVANAQKGASITISKPMISIGKGAKAPAPEMPNPSAPMPNPSAPAMTAEVTATPAPTSSGKGAAISSFITGKAAAKTSFLNSLMSSLSKGKGSMAPAAPAPAPAMASVTISKPMISMPTISMPTISMGKGAKAAAPEMPNPSAPVPNPSAPVMVKADTPAPKSASFSIGKGSKTTGGASISIGKGRKML